MQPTGEPREHHLYEVLPKSSSYVQIFLQDDLTGWVDILWFIFDRIRILFR